MKSIYEKFGHAVKKDIREYHSTYMSAVIDLYKDIHNSKNLVSKINSENLEVADTYLRFSLVFNDITLFHHPLGEEPSLIMLQADWFERNGIRDVGFSINTELAEKLKLNLTQPTVAASFLFPNGDDFKMFADKLLPFIESGKLVLQPERGVMVPGNEPDSHQIISVNEHSPLDSWELIDEASSRPVEITNKDMAGGDQELFQVVIPYLENVPYQDLAKVLADEQDLISQLRGAIKQAIAESRGTENLDEVRRDLIDPKVDALNRRLNTIVENHFFKIAAAGVGTAVLAYTAVSTVGMSSALATITGSGGLGLLANAYSGYRQDMNQIKDDPYYLLKSSEFTLRCQAKFWHQISILTFGDEFRQGMFLATAQQKFR